MGAPPVADNQGFPQRRKVFVGRGEAKTQSEFSACGKCSVVACALTKRVAAVGERGSCLQQREHRAPQQDSLDDRGCGYSVRSLGYARDDSVLRVRRRRRERAPALQNAVILRSKATKDPLRKNIRTIEGDSSLRSE